MGIASVVLRAIGPDGRIAVDAYDGSHAGPSDPIGTVVVRRPEAIRRFVTAPGELGVVRAYVAGDLEVEGNLTEVLEHLVEHRPPVDPGVVTDLVRAVGARGLRPLPPPPEEARLRGLRHSRGRDASAIAHHYDVSNDFYRLVLGPSLTYSCAVWDTPPAGLEAAQEAKHELICRKLRLQPGQRLLDVGCGWGSLVLHAARHHGVEAVGITISEQQAELATHRVKEAGLEGQVDIRLQDYRDVPDGPYDAISSVGMFEHVGRSRLAGYVAQLYQLLRAEGRLLNHGISRPPYRREAWPVRLPSSPLPGRTLIQRYVFPDGELHEIGQTVSVIQQQGFEVRHVENLREHYALTLQAWSANLDQAWDEAVAAAGPGRARVWRLYMAACAVAFTRGLVQLHQVLAVRADGGRSGFPLRPEY